MMYNCYKRHISASHMMYNCHKDHIQGNQNIVVIEPH